MVNRNSACTSGGEIAGEQRRALFARGGHLESGHGEQRLSAAAHQPCLRDHRRHRLPVAAQRDLARKAAAALLALEAGAELGEHRGKERALRAAHPRGEGLVERSALAQALPVDGAAEFCLAERFARADRSFEAEQAKAHPATADAACIGIDTASKRAVAVGKASVESQRLGSNTGGGELSGAHRGAAGETGEGLVGAR